MRIVTVVLFLLLPVSAFAEDRERFFGTWGTAKQCSRLPIKPGGTVLATPVEISEEWLKQGNLWCRLNWFPIETRETGYFSGARAQCGEDSIRDYLLGVVLSDEKLTLRWDLLRKNGPLARCPSP